MDQVLIVEKLDLSPFRGASTHSSSEPTTFADTPGLLAVHRPSSSLKHHNLSGRERRPGFELVSIPTETRSPNRGGAFRHVLCRSKASAGRAFNVPMLFQQAVITEWRLQKRLTPPSRAGVYRAVRRIQEDGCRMHCHCEREVDICIGPRFP